MGSLFPDPNRWEGKRVGERVGGDDVPPISPIDFEQYLEGSDTPIPTSPRLYPAAYGDGGYITTFKILGGIYIFTRMFRYSQYVALSLKRITRYGWNKDWQLWLVNETRRRNRRNLRRWTQAVLFYYGFGQILRFGALPISTLFKRPTYPKESTIRALAFTGAFATTLWPQSHRANRILNRYNTPVLFGTLFLGYKIIADRREFLKDFNNRYGALDRY